MGIKYIYKRRLAIFIVFFIGFTFCGFGQTKMSPLQVKESTAAENDLIKQADFLTTQINAQINDKGKDILVLAKGIKNFGKSGRAAWATNIIYFAREFKQYKVIKIVNNRGIEELKVVDSHQVTTYNDESGKKYFQETMKLNPGDIYVSSLLISNITNNKMIQLATPLVDLSTMDKGILLFEWLPQSLFDLAANLKVENNGHVIIVDAEGNYIYHPDKKKILNENITSNANESFKNIAQQMLSQESDVAEYQEGENSFQIGFAPYSQMGWVVAVIKPLNAAAPQMPRIPGMKEVAAAAPSPTPPPPPTPPVTLTGQAESQPGAAKIAQAEQPPQAEKTPVKDLTPITSATRKVLDGSLRNQQINSLRVVTHLEVTSPEGIKYQLKVRQAANLAKKSEYQKLLDMNKNTLITYNDFDERFFNHTKFEVISPAFLQETTITRYNQALVTKPLDNSAITLKTNEVKEYQLLTNNELVNLPRQFASLDFERFGNDTFDIKIIDGIPTYVITLELKQDIISKGLTFSKLKISIQGDYFMPIKLEWLDPRGENNLTISYEDMLINGFFSEKHFNVKPSPGLVVVLYSKLKPTLVATAKKREEKLGKSFSQADVRKLLIEALKKRGETIARGLVSASKKFIEDGNVAKLIESIKWAQNETEVSYVMIVDNKGETVVASRNQPSTNESATNLEVKYELNDGDKILGMIRVGLTQAEVDKAIEQLNRRKRNTPQDKKAPPPSQ